MFGPTADVSSLRVWDKLLRSGYWFVGPEACWIWEGCSPENFLCTKLGSSAFWCCVKSEKCGFFLSNFHFCGTEWYGHYDYFLIPDVWLYCFSTVPVFLVFYVLLNTIFHLSNTIFLLILAIISFSDISGTFRVVTALVLSFVMNEKICWFR